MSEERAADRWATDRTTFQRVYDVVMATTAFQSAGRVAEHAACSESGARDALEQLVEMGIAERRAGHPATYRRNGAYLTWRRVESLVRDHDPETLRRRVGGLLEEDQAFQDRFGVPEPDAVSTGDLPADEEALESRWTEVNEWRSVRRDIRVLRRAVDRAESRPDDRVDA